MDFDRLRHLVKSIVFDRSPYFSSPFWTVQVHSLVTPTLFHLRTGYVVGCRILVNEILVAFFCITSFVSTKLVARMNDIN